MWLTLELVDKHQNLHTGLGGGGWPWWVMGKWLPRCEKPINSPPCLDLECRWNINTENEQRWSRLGREFNHILGQRQIGVIPSHLSGTPSRRMIATVRPSAHPAFFGSPDSDSSPLSVPQIHMLLFSRPLGAGRAAGMVLELCTTKNNNNLMCLAPLLHGDSFLSDLGATSFFGAIVKPSQVPVNGALVRSKRSALYSSSWAMRVGAAGVTRQYVFDGLDMVGCPSPCGRASPVSQRAVMMPW
ncbi:uncharacterized protein CLUP02_02111 [Colletotrichum lupini]|uniref:Uncharacterized protein n=1 Tax=Colletotrichum lupini TaxID=145971 RepID=A0A9Q8WAB9_9PEZI|nr:uncharacterized protein CLUP02_02111 [Colletotrichum lupini]UQC75457.1 hypothetical protein CLUP02_02111 [Colletotrichum lupini]